MNYTRKDLARDLREGPFTSVGSYPKFWVTEDGAALSHAAVMADAKRYLRATGGDVETCEALDYRIIGCDINYENTDLFCDETGERIPSAYAEPEGV